MDRVYGYRSVISVAAILMALLGGGCAGPLFYNEANHKGAKTALEKVKALQVEQNAAITEMQANLVKSIQDQSAIFKEISAGSVPIACSAVLPKTLSGLLEELKSPGKDQPPPVLRKLVRRNDELEAAVALNLQRAKLIDASTEVSAASAEKALGSAKKQLTKWNKKVALFSKMIELLPAASALNTAATPDAWNESFETLKTEYGSAKVEYVDADGNPKSESLSDIVSDTWESADVENDKKIKEAVNNVFAAAPPGAVVILVSLANDIAQIQRSDAQEAVGQWSAAYAALMESERILASSRELAGSYAQSLESMVNDSNRDTTVSAYLLTSGEELKTGETGDPTQTNLGGYIQIVYGSAVAWATLSGPVEGLVNEGIASVHAIGHQRSLSESASAFNQHRAYVERSLETVEMYYASGVRPEKVGEFAFRLAELSIFAVMLGVIP